eukprot:gene15997-biopygen12777
MIQVGAGTSLAFQRLSRDTPSSILSVTPLLQEEGHAPVHQVYGAESDRMGTHAVTFGTIHLVIGARPCS